MLIDGTKRKEENTMIGGQPSAMMTGTSNMGQTGTKGATSSGGFTNLNKYLSANQGANNQTINKLNTTAQTSAKAAQDAITGAKTIGTSAQQNLDTIKSDQDFVSSSLSDPLKTNVNKFNTLRTSFNANPTQELNKFNEATSQANQIRGSKANELQNLTTSGGLTDWLRSQRSTPRYSQGSQSLDKFLIKGTDEGAKSLQNIGTQATQLQQEPTEFNELRSGIQTRSQALNPNLMNADQIQSAANQAFDSYLSNTDPTAGYTSQDASDSRYANVMKNWDTTRQNQALYGKQEIDRQSQRAANLRQALQKKNSIDAIGLINGTTTPQDFQDIINLVDPSKMPRSRDYNTLRVAVDALNIGGLSAQADSDLNNVRNKYGAIVNDFNQIQNQQWTGADLLQQDQLARINALAALSGQDPSAFLSKIYAQPTLGKLPTIGQTYYSSDGTAVQAK